MDRTAFRRRLPGYIATAFLILTTSAWVLWSVGEMYYEGWGLPFPEPLAYLIPGAACLALTLVALTWPRLGGWLIIGVGGAFTAWWWIMLARRSGLSWGGMLELFPVSGLLVVTGVLFLLEARYRRSLRAEGRPQVGSWFRRNLSHVVAVGLPLLVTVALSAYYLPIVLARQDDGDRSARLIEGNGVALVWAPAGPGWSKSGPFAERNLSWNELALFGMAPLGFDDKLGDEEVHASAADMQATGLCRYLSEDGSTLMIEPQDVWRMPTADEIVRSLVRHGENAGCTWDGRSESADCQTRPDKETPLWAPDRSPIYYWSADEYDAEEAYYVSYAGSSVTYQDKAWGNPRHGYRCVREP